MLRAVLVGLLSLSAVSCKSHDDVARSQPGGVAGKVVDLAGTVTVHHGDAAKPLAKGDSVEADDVIETGADGSVVIELAHNNVTWELGANKKQKVRDSLAWSQPKKDQSAKAVDQDSAAAGRHAERNAADTDVTGKADMPPAEKEVVADKKEAPPPPAEREEETRDRADSMPPPAASSPTTKGTVGGERKKEERTAVIAPHASSQTAVAPNVQPTPTAPPKTGSRARSQDDAVIGASAPGALAAPSGGGGGDSDGLVAVGSIGQGGGGGSVAQATTLVHGKDAELHACVGSTTLRLKISVGADGKATVSFVDKADAAVQACVKKVVSAIHFPKEKAVVAFTIK